MIAVNNLDDDESYDGEESEIMVKDGYMSDSKSKKEGSSKLDDEKDTVIDLSEKEFKKAPKQKSSKLTISDGTLHLRTSKNLTNLLLRWNQTSETPNNLIHGFHEAIE